LELGLITASVDGRSRLQQSNGCQCLLALLAALFIASAATAISQMTPRAAQVENQGQHQQTFVAPTDTGGFLRQTGNEREKKYVPGALVFVCSCVVS
jgi:hypothetical protein